MSDMDTEMHQGEDADIMSVDGQPEGLSETDIARVPELFITLTEQPWSYELHCEYITLLRRGFLHHRQTDPNSEYSLWNDLREARRTMHSIFRLSDEMYADWASDEIAAGSDWADIKAVFDGALDLHQETWVGPSGRCSVLLWKAYAEWMEKEFRATRANKSADADRRNQFDANSRHVAWEEAVENTQGSIPDSHEVWDSYRDVLLEMLKENAGQDTYENVKKAVYNAYLERLKVIHSNISETFSHFSTFITEYYAPEEYEGIMLDANAIYSRTSERLATRESIETRIANARRNGDVADEWMAYSEYIAMEKELVNTKGARYKQERKKMQQEKEGFFERVCAIFDRMVLRWGTEARVWQEYIMFVLENSKNATFNLATIGRASNYCPWSGLAWSLLYNALDQAFKPLEVVQTIRDKSIANGVLLNVGGLQEYLTALYAWLNYQKRRATSPLREADDVEYAELVFEQAMQEDGGKDLAYRLERICVDFYSEMERHDEARTIWKGLAQKHGDACEFWLRWLAWEVEFGDKNTTASMFNMALQRVGKKLDWPERIIEAWKEFVEDRCEPAEIEAMVVRYRNLLATIQERRAKEAAYTAPAESHEHTTSQRVQKEVTIHDEYVSDAAASTKRKRSEGEDELHEFKKIKSQEPEDALPVPNPLAEPAGAQPLSEESIKGRDRENCTIIVRNLPPDVTVNKIRQFFRECGNINTVNIVKEPDGSSATATIEFEGREEVLAAQTRDGKTFGDRTIQTQIGTGATIYVTNFPPNADEKFIRDLFEKCGTIVDVRFPSIKFKSTRRFCYVQFISPEEAKKALSLDGRKFKGKETLVVKISAPDQKKSREGALHEGRELYITNIDFDAKEEDVRNAFEKFGTIERIRLPPHGKDQTKHKGFGFVSFSKKDEADAALALNGVVLKKRVLDVSIASANPSKFSHHTNAISTNASGSPEGEDNDTAMSPADAPQPTREDISRRTFAIWGIPDTVNATRLRSLLEPYGPLKKLQLQPNHAGAIIEYEHVTDAGKASLALAGREFEGSTLAVGEIFELKKQKAFVRRQKGFESTTKAKKEEQAVPLAAKKAPTLFAPSSVARKGRAPTTRKPMLAPRVPEKAHADVQMQDADASANTPAADKSGKRSNADFRKLMLEGKK